MSRFYDALREASRYQPAATPEPELAVQSAEKAAPLPMPLSPDLSTAQPFPPISFVGEPEPVEPVVTAGPASEFPNVTAQELLDAAFRPRNGGGSENELGTKAILSFDEKARLLPQAADSVVVEHYRRLRTKILQQREVQPFRTIVIASSAPQEGKTVTTLNLGFSFAMLPSYKVLVIDGDLRRGTIGKWLGLPGQRAGFSELIEGTARLDDVVVRSDATRLQFLVRGNSTVPAPELLNSPRLGGLMRQIADRFDMVLVDSAPLSLVTDAQLLANHCDAVILTARAFHTTRKSLEQAARELHGFRIIGSVLNGGSRVKAYRRYNGYYYSE